MLLISCLNSLGFDRYFSHDRDPYAIQVMYDHTRNASYRHWCLGNVGRRVRLLALDGRNAELAGGFPSDPILSGPHRTDIIILFNLYESLVYVTSRNGHDAQHTVMLKYKIWTKLHHVGGWDPEDPHVFGPPRSGSISQRYGSRSGSFSFLIDVLSGLK